MYSTIVNKTVNCSKFRDPITLSAKYKYINDTFEATFMYASCPIVENKKLPEHKQNRELIFHYCFDSENCEFLKSFKSRINIKIDGYSQD